MALFRPTPDSHNGRPSVCVAAPYILPLVYCTDHTVRTCSLAAAYGRLLLDVDHSQDMVLCVALVACEGSSGSFSPRSVQEDSTACFCPSETYSCQCGDGYYKTCASELTFGHQCYNLNFTINISLVRISSTSA